MRNNFYIDGDFICIYLDRRDAESIIAFASLSDIDKLMSLDVKWYAHYSKDLDDFYVRSKKYHSDGTIENIYMHRYLMDAPRELQVDHIDNRPTNNTRDNLRLVTGSQNNHNRKGADKRNTTGIRGVSYDKRLKKYEAYVQMNYKKHSIDFYENAEDAKAAVEEYRALHMTHSKEYIGG